MTYTDSWIDAWAERLGVSFCGDYTRDSGPELLGRVIMVDPWQDREEANVAIAQLLARYALIIFDHCKDAPAYLEQFYALEAFRLDLGKNRSNFP